MLWRSSWRAGRWRRALWRWRSTIKPVPPHLGARLGRCFCGEAQSTGGGYRRGRDDWKESDFKPPCVPASTPWLADWKPWQTFSCSHNCPTPNHLTKSPMRLEDLTTGISLNGLEPSAVATIVAVVPIAEGAVQLIYKTPDGTLKDRLLNRADESNISIATTERPWSFEGDGEAFKLTVEAKRIDLAFLFDPMMAVHTSNVEPLPHQITAVYESMLPRQPLRFVLADDPGAGKTIMAGLYIRELIMRADARRIVVVAPGSLVEQWREEMFEKFGLEFRVFTRDLEAATPSGNPFEDIDHLIVRLDQMSRSGDSARRSPTGLGRRSSSPRCGCDRSDRPPSLAGEHIDPRPSGIQSQHFGLRHSRRPSAGRCGKRLLSAWTHRETCC